MPSPVSEDNLARDCLLAKATAPEGFTSRRAAKPSSASDFRRLVDFDGCIECTSHILNTDSDDMSMFNNHFDLLTRLVAASEQRQQVISHNIANVNTPKYRRLELDFESALAAEIRRGKKVGASEATPAVIQTQGLPSRADGNNVDIDKEIGQLGKNALLQQVYLQLMGTEMSQMRRAME